MERHKRVDHAAHGDDGEEAGANAGSGIGAKVEQTDGEAAEDDGEVEPGEEGALVGEEDFGLNSGGEGDALTRGRLQEGLGRHAGDFRVRDSGKQWVGRSCGEISGMARWRWGFIDNPPRILEPQYTD